MRSNEGSEVDLPCGSFDFGSLSVCQRLAVGATARMGVGTLHYQRLRQAGCHSTLLLAAQSG